MVKTVCAVQSCSSSSVLNKIMVINKELKFHPFPRDEGRCNIWLDRCKRHDLIGRSYDYLKNKHICSFHFEQGMYKNKNLKKTAVPTLRLPSTSTNTKHTQTYFTYEQYVDDIAKYVEVQILDDAQIIDEDEGMTLENHRTLKEHTTNEMKVIRDNTPVSVNDDPNENTFAHQPSTSTEQIIQHTSVKRKIGNEFLDKHTFKDLTPSSSKNLADLSQNTPRESKFGIELNGSPKRLKIEKKNENDGITLEQFLKACDTFLTPDFSAVVQARVKNSLK